MRVAVVWRLGLCHARVASLVFRLSFSSPSGRSSSACSSWGQRFSTLKCKGRILVRAPHSCCVRGCCCPLTHSGCRAVVKSAASLSFYARVRSRSLARAPTSLWGGTKTGGGAPWRCACAVGVRRRQDGSNHGTTDKEDL